MTLEDAIVQGRPEYKTFDLFGLVNQEDIHILYGLAMLTKCMTAIKTKR